MKPEARVRKTPFERKNQHPTSKQEIRGERNGAQEPPSVSTSCVNNQPISGFAKPHIGPCRMGAAAPYFHTVHMPRRQHIIGTIVLGVLCGCTLGPEYDRPERAERLMESYRRNAPATADATNRLELSRWWERMNDPFLNHCVDQLLFQNPRRREAVSRIEQARARLVMAGGARHPRLSVSTSAARRFQPLSTIPAAGPPGATAVGQDRVYITRLEAGLSTRWQVDLFGKLKKQAAAAQHQYRAAGAEADALTHSLIAQPARRRIALWTLHDRMALAERTLTNRALTARVIEARYRRGEAGVRAADVHRARESRAAAEAEIPALERARAAQAHAFDILLGRAPGTLNTAEAAGPLPEVPPAPTEMPVRLLDRRPDLRAAEYALRAATERVGVKIADLYPDLTLSGRIGYEHTSLSDFFDAAHLAGSLLADVSARLFEGGRLRAGIALQEARSRELAAAYVRQVLRALEEVKTAFRHDRLWRKQMETIDQRLTHLRSAATEAEQNVERGLVDVTVLLDLRRRLIAAEQGRLQTAQAAWNNRINLYLALGGDWEKENAHDGTASDEP